MWMLFARAPPPDAPYWSGRRWFAAVDAVAWPALWIFLLNHVSASGGLVGAVVIAVTALVALRRLCTALWSNHRYRFTTWRWGKLLAMLLLIGWIVKWNQIG